jgi:hypothetical protein
MSMEYPIQDFLNIVTRVFHYLNDIYLFLK